MRTLKLLGASLAAGALLSLSACGSNDEAEASAACLDSMQTAAAETDPVAADPLIIETLSACETADEWLAALDEHPGAMAYTDDAEIDDSALITPCYAQPDTPVCEDAEAQGRL
ncbi:MAG: hypothetical protein HLX51_06465 [Micrococcaceae bacterium]|nr:hypothetical protein [Micrococcaceae bacterium]